jgi:putative membrane-bound dehydrogenase-like protein
VSRLAALVVVVLLAAPVSHAAAGERPDDRLHVLFLGDHGHHEPSLRADSIHAPFARAGVAVDFTFETSDLRPDVLERYDALLIYANHEHLAHEQERALVDFVQSGHGLVAVHCASYCFLDSDAYVALVGGQFDHHAVSSFTARTLDAAKQHESMRGVVDFPTTDETYVHRRLASDLTLLQVRDEGDHADRAEPYTWVRNQGKGRVYYTALGHDEKTWGQPAFQQQLLQAIRWASGRPDFTWSQPLLEFGDANLPNYRPDQKWGVTGEPIRKLQLPLAPADERKLLQVPAGFDVQLFAAEPDVVKPIALSFDPSGRAWVAEAVDYPNDQQPPGSGHDRIVILSKAKTPSSPSSRNDATVERKVFADHLSLVTSVVVLPDGHSAIVAQAPDVLLLVDRDGDDVCDERRVLFSGFGTSDTHAGPSNFRLGPDGWIWGTVGYSGFDGVVGEHRDSPLAPADERHHFFQAVFRFKPDGSRLERVAATSNNTWGLGFSSTGEVFVSTANGDHLEHVVLPAQALESIPGLPTNATQRVPDHDRIHSLLPLRQVDYFGGFTAAAGATICTSPIFPSDWFDRVAFVCEPTGHLVHRCLLEPRGATFVSHDGWNVLESLDEWTAPIATEVGPDGALWVLDWYTPVVQHNPTPHGFTTGKGNAYETPHRDKQHGRIWRIVPQAAVPRRSSSTASTTREPADAPWPPPERRLVDADGAALVLPSDRAARARRLLELLDAPNSTSAASPTSLANDPWSPLAATVAATGVAREFLGAALEPRSSSSPGSPTSDEAPRAANLIANPSLAEVADDGRTPRSWRTVTYGGTASFDVAPLGHEGAAARSLRITSTAGADASWSQTVRVQRHATYRLSGWIKTESIEPLGNAFGALFNVHELQSPTIVRTPAVVGSRDWTRVEVTFDSGDHGELTVNALLGGWGHAKGVACFDGVELTLVSKLDPKLAAVRSVASFLARHESLAALALVHERLPGAPADVATAVLEGFADGWPNERRGMIGGTVAVLDGSTVARLREFLAHATPPQRSAFLRFAEKCGTLASFPTELAALLDELRAKLAARDAVADERVDAARRLLTLAHDDDAVKRVAAELVPLADPLLVKSLVAALGESGLEPAGEALLARLPQLTPAEASGAVELLLRRPAWAKRLLEQVVANQLDKGVLATDVLTRLLESSDREVAALAAVVAKRSGREPNADRAALLAKFAPVADRRGDAARGAVVFADKCSKCHTLRGQGGAVGPDLTNIGTRGKHDLLVEILDPNRSVEGTYRAWLVTTKDGDDLTGRILSESRTTIELVDASATKHVVARDDVASMRPLSRSVMPEGFEELGESDLAALLEHLVQDAKSGGSGGGAR